MDELVIFGRKPAEILTVMALRNRQMPGKINFDTSLTIDI
jgi:hypothetical protein